MAKPGDLCVFAEPCVISPRLRADRKIGFDLSQFPTLSVVFYPSYAYVTREIYNLPIHVSYSSREPTNFLSY